MMTRMRTLYSVGLAALACVILGGRIASAQEQPYSKETVMVPMPDGISLKTDVYKPEDRGTYPVILVRSPYAGSAGRGLGDYFATKGYVVVSQSVRGLDGSEGEFFPFVHEKTDGLATLEWILNQQWCDGSVGLWGVSYLGYCAWQIAEANHSAVKAMVATSSWADLGTFMTHHGAFQLQAHLRWFLDYAAGQQIPNEAWPGIFKTVPISQYFQGTEEVSGMAGEPFDYRQVQIPVYHITGWNDYIYPNVLEAFNALDTLAGVPPQFLMVGPWAHNDYHNAVTAVGEVDYGESAALNLRGAFEIAERWFDFWIKRERNGVMQDDPVKLFVMGENEWRRFSSWPPETAKRELWYLDSNGDAADANGSGLLLQSQPVVDTSDLFIYDPDDPAPTVGGAISHFFPENLGPRDQTLLEKRPDVLVYTSLPLEEQVTIVGPISLSIFASTSAPSTDFVGRLSVAKPNGVVHNIVDGIVRGYYEGGGEHLPEMTPDSIGVYKVQLGATAITLEAGSRLRLQVASSNFPKYDRNPNTGENPFTASEMVPATQRIYHGPSYPSHLVVPVLK